MSFSPFSIVFEPCHDSGNLVLAPETAGAAGRGGGRPGFSVPKPPFTRSTSYNSEFSSSTCGSLTDASSPPASSPSLGGLDSPTFGQDDDFRFDNGLDSLCRIKANFSQALPTDGIPYNLDPPRIESLRVVIIGGGIAGLATAIACARQGLSVIVLERSTIRSNFGDSIVIGSNASLLLNRWGIVDEMNESLTKDKYWVVHDDQGRELHREDLKLIAEKYGSPVLQGKRSQFTRVMDQEARRLGVDFRYDAEVTGYSDSQIKPGVILKGGEMVRGDVIVVCDGVRSTARRLMADKDSVSLPRKPSGYAIHRSIIATKKIKDDPVCSRLADGNIHFFLGDDCHAEVWPLDNGKQVAFTFTHLDSDGRSTLDWRCMTSIWTCLELMKNWDPSLVAAVEKSPATHHWTILADTVAPSWVSKGRKIVFAGDAVHPLSPASFQAGTQAIEDGATIALCLMLSGATPDRVPLALRVYEQLRRDRAEKAGELGRKQQEILHSFVPIARSKDPSQPRIDPSSTLRPLNFEMYDFDAEAFAETHFDALAREIELAEAKKGNARNYTSRYFAEGT
ncbi:hypothetical protein JCM3766R1_004390 [Sporobolomyces carnicolor]